MSENINKKITVSIPEEQKYFLELVIHEDAATNLSGAVQWCVDACMRIEKLYGVDACHVSFNDIRKEKYAIPASESTPNPLSPEIGDGGGAPADVPKMSDELAARSDVAALEYSKKHGRETYSYYENGSDLCDAHEAGQSWMYRNMQQEITQLKASLEESRNDTKVFKEWWEAAEVNIGVLTDKMIILKGAYEDLEKAKI